MSICKYQCVTRRYQIFSRPIPRLFSVPIFSRPVPRLFSVPIFFETGSKTFFGTKFFRFRFRYHKKIEEFLGTGILGTGMSNSASMCVGTNGIAQSMQISNGALKECWNFGKDGGVFMFSCCFDFFTMVIYFFP